MKKLLFSLLTSISLISFAQAPQEISYQGVARNVSGSLLANQSIGIKLDLHQGSSGGAIVFSETHSKTTNSFGLFTLGIGSVNSAAFTALNWANGPYFLEVSMDPAGGSSYTSVGIQQFMSVPYALYAKTAGNASPTYTAGTGINLSGNTISNTAPDQTVTITPAGSTSVTGTYPNFTINTPTTQAYTAGNGIDITGGVISNTAAAVTPTITGTGATTVNGIYPNLTINTPTVAPDQVVTLLGTNAATVTGAYPNFTVDVPNGTLLPAGLNGQLLFNNGTIWDTIPRDNLYFDGVNFGVGTQSPQTNFHVAGVGRFDASVETPQIYTDSIKITGGTTGQVLTSDAIGNGTWQTPTAPITPTITSSGIAVVTPTTGNVFNVDVPVPVLSYTPGTSVLSLSQGTTVTTATLVGTGSNTISIVGSGLASVTPTTGSTFTVSVPNPTLSLGSGSLTISGGNSIALPIHNLSINSNSLTINGPGGNTVLLPVSTTYTNGSGISITSGSIITNTSPDQTVTLNGTGATTVTGAYPNFTITSPTVAAATNPTITGIGATTVTSSGNTFTVNTPAATTYTNGSGISITSGSIITNTSPNQTVTLNGTGATTVTGSYPNFTITSPTVAAATNPTITGTGITTVTTSANNFTVNVPTQTLTVTSNSVITSNLGGTATITPAVLSYTAGTNTLKLTDGLSVNTVTLNSSSTTTLTQGTNVTILGSAPTYTVSSVTPTLNVVGGTLAGAYPTQTLTIPTNSTTNIAQGTNVSVTGTAPNYTVSAVTPTLNVVGGTLAGAYPTQTLTIPTNSTTNISQGTNVTVTGTAPNYTVSSVTPTLNVVGGTLTGAYPTQTLTVPTSSTTILTQSTGVTVTGSAPNYTLSSASQSLSVAGNLLSITGANTVTIPTSSVVAGNANITVTPSGNIFTVSAVTPTLSVVGGSIAGSYPTQTITISPATITGTGTGIATVTTSVNNFTVNVPSPTYTAASGVLSFGGTNTVVVSPTLTLTGSTLTSGAATNSVNLALLPGLWSASSTTAVVVTNTLNNVGIGTNNPAPQYKLDVIAMPGNSVTIHGFNMGSTDAFAGVYGENNNTGIGVYGQSNGGKGVFGKSTGGSGVGVYGESDAGNAAKFLTTNTLTASNAVNIQTNGTGAALFVKSLNANRFAADLKGDVNINGRVIIDSALSMSAYISPPQTANGNQGRIYYDRTLNKFRVSENSGAYVNLIGGGGPSPWLQSPGRVTLNNLNDSVGIGTSTPTSKLHVFGSSDPLQIAVENTGAAFKTGYNIKTFGQEWFIGKESGPLNGLHFSDITKGQARMVIETTGNVGIGTLLPSEKLDVSGNIKLDSTLMVKGLTSYPSISTFGNGRIYFDQISGKFKVSENAGAYVNLIGGASPWSQSGSNIYQTNLTDKVGIGTTTPGFSLDVIGNARFSAGISSGGQISIGNSGNYQTFSASEFSGLGAGINLQATGAGGRGYTMYSANGSGLLKIDDEKVNVTRFVIDSTGNIGIGTITPSARLHVNGTTKLVDGTQGVGKILTSDASGNATWQMPAPALSGGIINRITKWTSPTTVGNANIIDNGSITMNPTTSLPGVIINSNAVNAYGGNLSLQSIGPAPTAGTGLGSVYFGASGGMYDEAGIRGERDAASSGATDLPSSLVFYTTFDNMSTNAERMRINNAGNVGIGTNSPLSKLHAINTASTGSSVGRFENNSALNSAEVVFVYNKGTGAAIHAISEFTNSASNTALWVENGHIKATGGIVTVGTTTVVGGFSTIVSPTIFSNSNDVKGTFSFNTGVTGFSTTNYAEIEIRFAKNYSLAPIVNLTPLTDMQGLDYLVTNVTTTSFFVRVYRSVNTTQPLSVSGSPLFKFNYMVIE